MNLTKMSNCYTKPLSLCLGELREDYEDIYISAAFMRQRVLDIIESTSLSPAKKRFIEALTECSSKRAIYQLCCNAVNKATNYKV